jgi:ECF transporter S component (folate family)
MHKQIRRLTLAATLTALSVVIDVLFKQFVPADMKNIFGLPFYAMPLIIGSMLLGPIYGVLMAITADFLAVLAAGDAYLPLFVIAAIWWGFLPGIINKNFKSFYMMLVTVLIAHLLATISNSLAILAYGFAEGEVLFWTTLVKVGLIPVNTFILSFIVYQINLRLEPMYLDLTIKTYKTKKVNSR